MKEKYREILKAHLAVFALLTEELSGQVINLINDLKTGFQQGKKLLVFGNGGSAADAQHLAAELMGRFKKERACLPVYALTTNSSLITALGNDYDFSQVFSRQLTGIVEKGDIVLGISTSGNAQNVIEGLKIARQLGAITYLLTGNSGGRAAEIAQNVIKVPSDDTARIQEAHIFIIHTICELLEEELFA